MTTAEKKYLFNELRAIRKAIKTMAASIAPSMRQLINQHPGLGEQISQELKKKK